MWSVSVKMYFERKMMFRVMEKLTKRENNIVSRTNVYIVFKRKYRLDVRIEFRYLRAVCYCMFIIFARVFVPSNY